jgi:hypothetical protein
LGVDWRREHGRQEDDEERSHGSTSFEESHSFVSADWKLQIALRGGHFFP